MPRKPHIAEPKRKRKRKAISVPDISEEQFNRSLRGVASRRVTGDVKMKPEKRKPPQTAI